MDTSTVSNPWASDQRSQGPYGLLIQQAELSGHLKKRRDRDIAMATDHAREQSPSLQLFQVLRQITAQRKELDKVNVEVQCRLQDQETNDITDLSTLENRIKQLNELSQHLQAVMQHKSHLKSRLQKPFVGEYLHIAAQYQRCVSEVFPMLAPILSDLQTNLDNIHWASTFSMDNGHMDRTLDDLTASLARLQTGLQSLVQLRGSVSQMHHTSRSQQPTGRPVS
ncbi:PREDICTED: AUGMIN subunit 2-like [Branchiostoma belcheri]|uniref:AUGMIN subunit 2-like n=1 Tax=Branchiostoma belcheri TaxID=7741 RepID=A0A6P5AKP9_BRABE|nr:PREDICTED: AUGMIN subunit 2-like [Branchiostoma belcheri]